MARRTTNKGLYVWDLATDLYDHEELAANWDLLDTILAQAATACNVITSLPASAQFGDIAITSGDFSGFKSGTLIRYDGSLWKAVGPVEAFSALPTQNNFQGRIIVLSQAVSEFAANDIIVNIDGANTWARIGGINVVSSVASSTNNYPGKVIILNQADNTLGSGGPYAAYDLLVYNDSNASFQVIAGTPSGAIQMYGGTTAPKGWLLCNGSAYLRVNYPTLFSAISTNFGVDSLNPGNTFRVPDFRGRMPAGYAASGGSTEASLMGNNEGVASKMRRPEHRHTISSAAHTHTLDRQQIQLPTRYGYDADHWEDLVWADYLLNKRTVTTHTETVNSNGPDLTVGNSASDSLDAPPYLVVNFIIKI